MFYSNRCNFTEALNFVSTSLGDLLHLLDDVFGRLTNVCQLQKAMADRRTWNKQSLAARRQRERYLSGEGHVARSFYGLATGILSMLTVLARQATPLFLHASNLPKCVTLVLHTFRALCDTSASAEINVSGAVWCVGWYRLAHARSRRNRCAILHNSVSFRVNCCCALPIFVFW